MRVALCREHNSQNRNLMSSEMRINEFETKVRKYFKVNVTEVKLDINILT